MLLFKEIMIGLLFVASVFFIYLEMKQDKWPQDDTEGLKE